MEPAYFEMRLRRGRDWVMAFRLVDRETGAGIALDEFTGMDWFLKPAAGTEGPPTVTLSLAGSSTVTGITKIAAAEIGDEEGWFQACIRDATIATIPGTADIVRMGHSLRLTDLDGFKTTFAHGPCVVIPEISNG